MISKNIAKLRKSHGLTQSKFAEEIHVTQAAVSQWETGKTTPDIQQVFIIAEFFGITVEDLSGDLDQISEQSTKTEESPATQAEDKFMEIYRQLNEENRRQVVQYLEFLRQQQ